MEQKLFHSFAMPLAGRLSKPLTQVYVRENFGDWKDGHCRLGHVDFGLMVISSLLPSCFQKDTCLEVVLKQIYEGSKKLYFWRGFNSLNTFQVNLG